MRFLSLTMMIALAAGPLAAFQKPKEEAPPKPALTDEEKEILKSREMLENLEMLQDLDKFRFFDFLTVSESPAESKEMMKPEANETKKDKNEKKKK